MNSESGNLLAPYRAPFDDQQQSASVQSRPQRRASIDVYRGIVMFLMLAELLHLSHLVRSFPDSKIAQWLAFHTSHVAWTGCSLHDLIQPSFSFLVGVSLPFSLASRRARGDSFWVTAQHAAIRSVILILLGIILRSWGRESTNFFFVDTLTQIGLGYFVLFLLANAARWIQFVGFFAILILYWAFFAFWPLPASDFVALVPEGWDSAKHDASGFAAHWNINANPAWRFDTWFMNLFPQDPPYSADLGGYCTLNFVPTLATMLLGLFAGQVLLKDHHSTQTVWILMGCGLLMLLVGWGLGELGICPVVKKIWTPSWVLFSGGWCFLIMATLYLICDVGRIVSWSWPLLVIGANSIVAYIMSWTMRQPIEEFLLRHFGTKPFEVLGDAWEPVLLGAAILIVMWLVLFWLFRQKIFVRI